MSWLYQKVLHILAEYCDEESFLMELNDQKQQLKKLLNLMVKNFQGRKEISAIWLAIEGDNREYFINNFEKETVYKYLAGGTCLFALIKYFNRHPTASKIILECMEKNKLEKDEKNFYINLMELPKKPMLFHSFWN